MAANLHPSIILYPCFLLIIISSIPQSSCQSGSALNIQTFFPFPLTPFPPPSNPMNNKLVSPMPSPTSRVDLPLQLPPLPVIPTNSPSSKKAAEIAVVITVASTLILSGLLFFLLRLYSKKRKRDHETSPNLYAARPVMPQHEFMRFNGNLKGIIVDEDGLDVIYWRNLQEEDGNKGHEKQAFKHLKLEKEVDELKVIIKGDHGKYEPRSPEVPLLKGKSSTSESPIWSVLGDSNRYSHHGGISPEEVGKLYSSIQVGSYPPPLPPASPFPPPKLAAAVAPAPPVGTVPKGKGPLHPPPPPIPPRKGPPRPAKPAAAIVPAPPLAVGAVPKGKGPLPPPIPPPSPPIPLRKGPPPPPIPPKKGSPPAKASSLGSPPKPPPFSKGLTSDNKRKQPIRGEGVPGNGDRQVKLKPLYWDKVNANVDHSMVWDRIEGGSFKVDDDLMEALFGYAATNRKSPRSHESTQKGDKAGSLCKIFILDARKSQNTAIILKSLAISREEIIDTLIQGEELNVDTLEKLTRIAPTKEEESEILAFDGDHTRLADAESFLYHLLKSVPSAFTRFNAMFFRSNFKLETSHLKESFQTLDLGCKELRGGGLLLKLLEAVLKAGNRMNAGTSRGNAQAFELTALKKLSDVKSTDGKTTLLHFLVEEVVRIEGKRCAINRKASLSHSSSQSSNNGSSKSQSTEDREKEYKMLGLTIVGGLSTDFSNLKKAASIDYDGLVKTSAELATKLAEIQKFVQECDTGGGGFCKEMKTFLHAAEREMCITREEQTRVTELVKRTTEYFQPGASQDKCWQPLQIFVIVKDFLGMVDKVCVDITRNLKKRKPVSAISAAESSWPESTKTRPSIKFPKLPPNFMSCTNSSDSDAD